MRNERNIFKRFFKRSEGFLNKFNNDWTMQSAGVLAYNLMVAIIPIILAIIAIFGFTVGALDPNAQDQLINGIEKAFPGNFSKEILQVVFTSLRRSAGFLTILAILTSVFGGSRLFIAIEGCFDIIYRTYPRGVIAQNVMAILMMLFFVVLVPLMVFASSLPALLLSLVQNVGIISGFPVVAQLTNNGLFLGAFGVVSGIVISWLLFETIFLVVPNQPVSLKNSWRGALLSASLLELFLALFPLYITHFMGSYIGTAGLAVVLLVFFYYFAVILLLGAQVNAYFGERVQPLPNNLAAVLHDAAAKHAAPPASANETTRAREETSVPEPARSADDSH
jgi:YihY family inner membrane protein